MSKESGRIWLDGDLIRYKSNGYGAWEVPVAKVRLIAEVTLDCGPFVDDYFLVFVVGCT